MTHYSLNRKSVSDQAFILIEPQEKLPGLFAGGSKRFPVFLGTDKKQCVIPVFARRIIFTFRDPLN